MRVLKPKECQLLAQIHQLLTGWHASLHQLTKLTAGFLLQGTQWDSEGRRGVCAMRSVLFYEVLVPQGDFTLSFHHISPAFITWDVLGFLLLWRDTMTMATLIKEKHFIGLLTKRFSPLSPWWHMTACRKTWCWEAAKSPTPWLEGTRKWSCLTGCGLSIYEISKPASTVRDFLQ